MITNERQLQISKAQAERFRESLEAMEGGSLDQADLHPLMKTAQIDAVRSQLDTLLSEIREYEELRSGAATSIELQSLSELPDGLIKARIAAGLTQKDLAERLGLREQQIQRYESSRYDGVSFARIVDVADAIGIKVQKTIEVLKTASSEAVLKRLRSIGLTPEFIKKRISPDLESDESGTREVVQRVSAIFGWSPEVIFGSGTIDPAGLGGATARFKMPRGRDARSVTVYTAYAHHLAGICAAHMEHNPRKKIPTNWKDFRDQLISRYAILDFKSAVRFAWDLGVVVLPLNDVGSFHGACWRFNGINVIVLKQSLRYPARWLFDLLHELRHAGEKPDALEFEVVEDDENSEERRLSKEEQEASWFAGQITLDGDAEALVKESLSNAHGDLRQLKSAIVAVAAKHSVDVGLLANYMAFRLSLQGENWWGVATKLQDKSYDPLDYARNIFFERFSFGRLDPSEMKLLTLALHDEGGSHE